MLGGPSLDGLIIYLTDKEALSVVEHEYQYAESLVKKLESQGLTRKKILEIAIATGRETWKHFFDFRREITARTKEDEDLIEKFKKHVDYGPANFIFVGVNKDGLPKIAIVDV